MLVVVPRTSRSEVIISEPEIVPPAAGSAASAVVFKLVKFASSSVLGSGEPLPDLGPIVVVRVHSPVM